MICAERELKDYITDSPETPSFPAGNDLGEEGLYYFNARWYDASLGRFITEDPIKDGINWYAYVSNNPLKYVDPTGLAGQSYYDPTGRNPGGHVNTWRDSPDSKPKTNPSAAVKDRITDGSIPALPEEGPCLMRALMGAAETYTDKNLTENQIVKAIKELDKTAVDVQDDFWVEDPEAIISETLDQLGVDPTKLDIVVAKPGDPDYDATKENADASIRAVERRDGKNPGEAGHYQEGDSEGDFVFDPIDGDSDGDRTNLPEETRYITITPKKEDEE